ncbi:ATP-binding SpoIIE family protein phosphatase [Singulisphaera acidiphila]|uniref:Anti-sigma regulatory factor (Ser/Thr protein kinase) n=1 Tax=Singulisphaera acidiphila (strain ATCC BAA-1392 / DSM 18658 / VKM B-2454 / MOB10) TaxID=886293 RepID=L0D8K9_SINAD|nr:SpoIIE family protein phosphatase [Singulisphaera acidiphila]AGA25173.1 anti-sigma regulatory factor (Ser/Thr protein kinase) [Singulisphaera acidiphila DSM 18658]
MIPGEPLVLTIDDVSKVGEARRLAVAQANRLGFDETGRGRVAIVVTEAATNLFKHAVGGELILQDLEIGQVHGLEVLSIDRGPGMADVGRCFVDGFSTAGSPGHGLGAISRLSSSFEIDSVLGVGTLSSARLWAVAPTKGGKLDSMEWGVVSRPFPGEEVCGDAWAIATDSGQTLMMVADGLGHGPQAAEASHAAVRAFQAEAALGPAGILAAAHEVLRGTRGAAMAVARLDPGRREIVYCGVGNIAGTVVKPGSSRGQSMVSHNGTVGHAVRKIQEFVYPWEEGSLVVMHSDGLGSHWRLDGHAGLAWKSPCLIAGGLYRDSARGRDDVTVLVVRERSE